MKFLIEIDMGNDAFKATPDFEIFQVLGRLQDRIQAVGLEDEVPLIDTNGNRVGTAILEMESK